MQKKDYDQIQTHPRHIACDDLVEAGAASRRASQIGKRMRASGQKEGKVDKVTNLVQNEPNQN